jgi:ectoine hydroxylase-related dioxygenase (phytanoyl-CoA dioxygenase family)
LSFPGERPLSINTIVYLDRMDDETGPTYVVPGSHRGETLPQADERDQPLPNEVPIYAEAGDAAFINSAVWHSGSCNRSSGLRHGIYIYFGHWWMKRYEEDFILPSEYLEGASEARLRLLGYRMPDKDLHICDPSLPFG